MNIFRAVFVLFQLYIHDIDGLVFAGYSVVTRQEGISSLDRYRCAETYVGFEYIGHVLTPDGVCTPVQYGRSDVMSPGSEYLKKTWNCNVFDTPIALFKVNDNNYIRYDAPIPGELVTGSSIEVVFIPQEPWNQIVLSLFDDSESNNVLHTSFRSDLHLIHFNSIVSGQWADMKHANGVEIKSGSAATLTVEILTDTLK
ncbi:uncharacterized protein LOC132732389, partial [Ruditapes philippinarum]|uniref:uncharacterized protein LOC132732389 n=1 Tax=Ruditapes philippinarum TaxID=129788 RepID=UPI00295BF85E